MKHGYLIKLFYPEGSLTMHYCFKTCKEACAYGEYKFRESYDLEHYEILKCIVLSDFYKLK